MADDKKKNRFGPDPYFCPSPDVNYHEDDIYDEREDYTGPRIYIRGDRE